MLEQLGNELETRTQKKDKYKDKYLEEKQRAATLRDYYKGEMSKSKEEWGKARDDFEKAIAELRTKNEEMSAAKLEMEARASVVVEPIVYPAVSRSQAGASKVSH